MTAVVPIEKAKPAAEVQPERVGVLLVNLGTPDTADARGVRVYLKEFLSDPRVIEDQGLKWKLLLNGIILRIRPARKARDYRKIWNTKQNESPLKTITRAQSEKLAAAISDHGDNEPVLDLPDIPFVTGEPCDGADRARHKQKPIAESRLQTDHSLGEMRQQRNARTIVIGQRGMADVDGQKKLFVRFALMQIFTIGQMAIRKT